MAVPRRVAVACLICWPTWCEAAELAAPLQGGRAEEVGACLRGLAVREGSLQHVAGLLRQDNWHTPGDLAEPGTPKLPADAEGVALRSQFVVRFNSRGLRFRFDSLALAGGPNAWSSPIGLDAPPPALSTKAVLAVPLDKPLPLFVFCADGQRVSRYHAQRHELRIEAQTKAHNPLYEFLGLASGFGATWSTELGRGWNEPAAARLDLPGGVVEDLPVATRRAFVRERDEELLSRRCLRLVWLTENPAVRVLHRVWVSPALAYAVLRSEYIVTYPATQGQVRDQSRADVSEAAEFREVAPGILLPQSTVWSYYEWVTPGPPRWVRASWTRFESLVVNQPEASDEFQVAVPFGTCIADATTREVTYASIGRSVVARPAGGRPVLAPVRAHDAGRP